MLSMSVASLLASYACASAVTAETPAPTDQATLVGLAPATDMKFETTVSKRKEPVFRFPSGLALATVSIRVTDADGTIEMGVSGEPNPPAGEYRVLADSSLLFSTKDAGRKAIISCRASQRRIAVLPVVNQSQLDYMSTTTKEAIVENLEKQSYVVLPNSDVTAAVRAEGIDFDPAITGVGDKPSSESIMSFARKLNVSAVVLSTIGKAATKEGQPGYVFMGNVLMPYSSKNATSAVSVAMFDGATAKLLFAKSKTGSKGEDLWGGTRGPRQSLARKLVGQIFAEYFGAD